MINRYKLLMLSKYKLKNSDIREKKIKLSKMLFLAVAKLFNSQDFMYNELDNVSDVYVSICISNC